MRFLFVKGRVHFPNVENFDVCDFQWSRNFQILFVISITWFVVQLPPAAKQNENNMEGQKCLSQILENMPTTISQFY